jgi:hypothetical protein
MSEGARPGIDCQFCLGPISGPPSNRLCEACGKADLESVAELYHPVLSGTHARREGQAGRKLDGGKPPWDLLPWTATSAVVDVLEHGRRKYGADNWRSVPEARRRYFAAAMRHMVAWFRGEKNDQESGLPHLAHACCCMLFLLEQDEAV